MLRPTRPGRNPPAPQDTDAVAVSDNAAARLLGLHLRNRPLIQAVNCSVDSRGIRNPSTEQTFTERAPWPKPTVGSRCLCLSRVAAVLKAISSFTYLSVASNACTVSDAVTNAADGLSLPFVPAWERDERCNHIIRETLECAMDFDLKTGTPCPRHRSLCT